jgi:hypothetical protein
MQQAFAMTERVAVDTNGDVPILIVSESCSDDEHNDEHDVSIGPSIVYETVTLDVAEPVVIATGTTEPVDIATDPTGINTGPVAVTIEIKNHVDIATTDNTTEAVDNNPHATNATSTHTTATVPPQHLEDEENDEFLRSHVLTTCAQLLHKLETVRLSVLHLQYSLHAGELGAASVEHTTRANDLWTWDKPSVFGTIFVPGVPSEEIELSQAAFSDINVFGGGTAIGDIELAAADLDTISKLTETYASDSAESCV